MITLFKKTIAAALFAGTLFLQACSFCGVGEKLVTDPQRYMQLSSSIEAERNSRIAEGHYPIGIFPEEVDIDQVTDYLQWYKESLFGPVNYAISATVQYTSEDDLMRELERLAEYEGFSAIFIDEKTVIGRDLVHRANNLFDKDVLDGNYYLWGYAIIDCGNYTVRYTEALTYEGQELNETLKSELLWIANSGL